MERMGLGKVYGVGATIKLKSRLMVVQHLPYAVGSVYSISHIGFGVLSSGGWENMCNSQGIFATL